MQPSAAEGHAGAVPRLIAGRYRLAEQIGRGGMGTVWRARDELLDRDVAVKEVTLPSTVSQAERDNSYERTLREARAAARLGHQGVAAVHDVVEEFGRPWIIMELVHGRPLDRVIAETGPLSPQAAAEMGHQVALALGAAHSAGILHRDVKPGNVLLATDGRTLLTDFGIATAAGDASLTQTGMLLGSPGFLAPERINGSAATPASDLWSLGATLYAAVEGKGPYDGRGGVMTTMAAVVTQEPPPPRSAGPLGPAIRVLLSRDPEKRPSATAAARMLEAIARRGADGARTVLPVAGTPAHPAGRPGRGPGGMVPLTGTPPAGSAGYGAPRSGSPGYGIPPNGAPRYGTPPKRARRRRWIVALVIAAVAIFAAAGAYGHGQGAGGPTHGVASSARIGSPVRDGKFQLTVTRISHAKTVGDTADGFGDTARGEYMLVQVTVTNIGSRSQSLNDFAQYVYDAAGRRYSTSFRADLAINATDGGQGVLLEPINPGDAVRAVFAFDMPPHVKAVAIELHDSVFSGGVTVKLT